MVLETLALIALWKLATRSSKKMVLVRRRKRSTAGSVFALVGVPAVSTLPKDNQHSLKPKSVKVIAEIPSDQTFFHSVLHPPPSAYENMHQRIRPKH